MICTKCGQEFTEGSHFCENCGAPVSVERPDGEAVHEHSNQKVSPGAVSGMLKEEITLDQPEAKKPAKSWIWTIVIILIVIGCCCLTIVGGGLVYLRNRGQSWQDLFSND